MKKISLIACIIYALIFAGGCTKTDVQPLSENSAALTSESKSSNPTNTLTQHPWSYQGFYFNYVDKHNKGDVQYLRGGSNNIINLDETRITFMKNGKFIELDGGYSYPGTWSFSDSSATVLIMNFSFGTDVDSIVKFNSNHLNFTQPMGYKNKSYTELIPLDN